MKGHLDLRLYLIQRLTAALMAPFVLIHLSVILYAMGGGLTGEEILSRTRGSLGWGLFYGAFVIAAALHGSIGLRNILDEISPVKGRMANLFALLICVFLLAMGLRAVVAIS